MKRFIIFMVIFILALAYLPAACETWQTTKSTHFIVYHKKAPANFLKNLIDYSEKYYEQIADALGFRRFNFWLWDNRAKIYIHDDASQYQLATGQPSWSSGSALPRDKIIHTFPNAAGFFENILPHELGHIIFREFVGFDNNAIPIWLEEGVASYQEKTVYAMADKIVKSALAAGKIRGLKDLSGFDPRVDQDKESVNMFYAESVSIVAYLIKEFGRDYFVLFCQKLRDREDLTKALAYIYPFRDMQELEEAWKKYLAKDTSYKKK